MYLMTSFYYVNIDHEICCYECIDGVFRRRSVFRGPSAEVTQIQYSQKRQCLYSCGADGLFLWDLQREGKCSQLFPFLLFLPPRLVFPVRCICSILDDSVLVAGTPEGSLLFLDTLDQCVI